jgi:DNA mismatch repair protein MutS2
MMFDEKTLEPMYKLALGQAGKFLYIWSAENGIPFSLINRAKEEVGKVRLIKL